jgi:nucleoid-associated protein YgaU
MRETPRFILLVLASLTLLFAEVALAGASGGGLSLPIRVGSSGPTHDVRVTVEVGDNLWSISAAHLRESRDGPLGGSRISPYWREVIAINQAHLSSGDPDLIFPGEVVRLPPIDENDQRTATNLATVPS